MKPIRSKPFAIGAVIPDDSFIYLVDHINEWQENTVDAYIHLLCELFEFGKTLLCDHIAPASSSRGFLC